MERAAAEELANSFAAPHAAQTSSAIPAVFALMAAAQGGNLVPLGNWGDNCGNKFWLLGLTFN